MIIRYPKFHIFSSSIDPLGQIINDEAMEGTGKLPLQLHTDKCILLVLKVLGPFFLNELLNDLHHANTPYSYYVDDTTDISVKKLCTFSVRYYSHRFKTIKDTFLCLKEVVYTTADEMVKVVVDVNNEKEMDTDEFTSLCTDTTNSMTGDKHSLKTEAKKEYPLLLHIHCKILIFIK